MTKPNTTEAVSPPVEGWEKYGKEIPLRSCQVIVGEIQAVGEGRSGVDAWRNISCEIESLLSSTLTTLVKEMEGLRKLKTTKREFTNWKGKTEVIDYFENDGDPYFNAGISAAIEVVKKMGV